MTLNMFVGVFGHQKCFIKKKKVQWIPFKWESKPESQIFLDIPLGLKIKGKVLGEKNFLWLRGNKNIWKAIGDIWQI